MSNNPATAAAEFLNGRYDDHYGHALRSLFTTQVGTPANYTSAPASTLGADNLRNLDYKSLRRGPVSMGDAAPPKAENIALAPSSAQVAHAVFAQADAVYAQKLNKIADITRDEFKGMASGLGTPAAAAPQIVESPAPASALPPTPRTPISYSALEMDIG